MVTVVVLDTGPLGLLTNPKMTLQTTACRVWFTSVLSRGHKIVVPEIADYELRRELVRAGKLQGLRHLEDLLSIADYLPISTPAMRKAAELWAEARKTGQPTAANAALDGDVILAAQTPVAFSTAAIIATRNVGHLARFTLDELWNKV